MIPERNGMLSVVLPNYNHAEYIGEALEAILNQSFRPHEVIVVDDASTDDSIAVIERFVKRDPIIRLVRNDRNRGVAFSTNRGLRAASGDLLFPAAADDKVLPGFLEKSMRLLADHPQAGLCCGDTLLLAGDTAEIREHRFFLSLAPTYIPPEKFARIVRRRFYLPVASATVIWRKSAFEAAGGYKTELQWASDWFAEAVVGFRHGICYIPEPLAVFRIMPESLSAQGHRHGHDAIISNVIRLLERPEYGDVRPLFQRTSALTCCPGRVLREVLRHRSHWTYLSAPLILHALWDQARRITAPFVPEPVKQLYRRSVYKLI